MNGASPFAARHRAVIRAIDAGAVTLSAICAEVGCERLEAYESIKFLRRNNLAETVSRGTRVGDQARYRLVLPIDSTLARVPLDGVGGPDFGALQEALGMPEGVQAVLAYTGQPRAVEVMGCWPPYQPKPVARTA